MVGKCDRDEITFFDFDFFGYRAFANDIMTFWQHLSIDALHGRLTPEEFEQSFAEFRRGYEAVRRIDEREITALPYLSPGFWLFYMNFHSTHDQFYPFVQPDHLKLRTDFIKKLMAGSWATNDLP